MAGRVRAVRRRTWQFAHVPLSQGLDEACRRLHTMEDNGNHVRLVNAYDAAMEEEQRMEAAKKARHQLRQAEKLTLICTLHRISSRTSG